MLEVILYIALGVLTLIAAIMIRQLTYALRHFELPSTSRNRDTNAEALPSVSVCIPARNEHHALTECLESVLQSTYPKLEVIVLDDSSRDDTPTLIKSFANAGVRFVQGSPLPKGWLGKNHALQGLLEQASGSYVLFMGVDTRLQPSSIQQLITYAEADKLAMVTVLPRREDGWRASVLLSPLRYFWEIIFHRRLWPATASGTWLMRRDVLRHRFQGFKTFKDAIQPETKMATELAGTGEYRFIMSSASLGIHYEKKWRSQIDTSLRLLYPLLNSQLALVTFAVFDLIVMLIPFVIIASALFVPITTIHAIALIYGLLFCGIYGVYAHRVWKRGWLVAAVLWPLLLIQEIIVIVLSTIKHQRGTVQWKGRPIRLEA